MKEGRTMSRRKKGEEREEQARPREWMELERRGGRMGRAHFVGLLQSLDLRRERIHQDTNVGIFERPHGGKNSRDWSERKEKGGRKGRSSCQMVSFALLRQLEGGAGEPDRWRDVDRRVDRQMSW